MWDRFFDLDNVVWRTIDKIGKIFLLNLLWLICSLPVFTIGASTTALIYTSMKLSDNEGYWHQNFFSSFKENFKQATGVVRAGDAIARGQNRNILIFHFFHSRKRFRRKALCLPKNGDF